MEWVYCCQNLDIKKMYYEQNQVSAIKPPDHISTSTIIFLQAEGYLTVKMDGWFIGQQKIRRMVY